MATQDVCARVGNRIRQLRREREWSQVYLAVHTGMSKTFICNLENGQKEPCLRTIEILADGFGLSLGEFFSVL